MNYPVGTKCVSRSDGSYAVKTSTGFTTHTRDATQVGRERCDVSFEDYFQASEHWLMVLPKADTFADLYEKLASDSDVL
jgi:hypothetical protein